MKEFFSVHEIANMLKISRSAVLYDIKTGKLNATQVGKFYIVSKEDLGEFLLNQKEKKNKLKDNQTKLDL